MSYPVTFDGLSDIDLYLVYNEVLNTRRAGKFPVPPPSAERALLLKYSYTFNL